MKRFAFYGLLAAGVAFRIFMLTRYELVNGGEVDAYLADEGVVGLMGKHILQGDAAPVFFYGQAYLGALEAYCAALSFALFGVSFASLRLVPFLFSLAVLVVVYHLARRLFSREVARWATALTAVAPMYFLQWNLKARGGFVEHVFLVLAVILLFWRFYFDGRRDGLTAAGLGFTAGLALWVNQLAIAYVIVLASLLLLSPDRRGFLPLLVGLTLGCSLLIGYNVVHPMATVRALARKAIVLNRVPVEQRDENWAARGAEQRIAALKDGGAKLALVFGVPPGAAVERLGLRDEVREGGALTETRRRLWFVPAAVFVAALLWLVPHIRRGSTTVSVEHLLLLLFAVTFAVGYVSPRYMLPAYPLAAIAFGAWAAASSDGRRTLRVLAGCAVLVLNVVGWADASLSSTNVGEETGQRLLAFLKDRNLTRCYSAAPLYHLVFRSGEDVLLVPLQKDRIPAYDVEVLSSDSVCYVFRDDQEGKLQHVAMMEILARERVAYRRDEVGHYRVLWELSPRAALSATAIDKVRTPSGDTVRAARSGEEPWT